MIRDSVLACLADSPGGATLFSIVDQCELSKDAETLAALELLCHYTPEVGRDRDKWKAAKIGRGAQILAAIENYAVSSGRKIFRLSAALAAIPPHEHPTEEEVAQALGISHGRFELLPNAMIRKNH